MTRPHFVFWRIAHRSVSCTHVAWSLLLAAAPLAAQPTQPLDGAGLTGVAQRWVLAAARRDAPDADVHVVADPLDTRLRFPACDDLKLSQHGRGYGRTSI